MCYLVAKWFSKEGSTDLQLVTISRPSAYGEYEPYEFVDSENELIDKLEEQTAA